VEIRIPTKRELFIVPYGFIEVVYGGGPERCRKLKNHCSVGVYFLQITF
jgi:hypothetical protein